MVILCEVFNSQLNEKTMKNKLTSDRRTVVEIILLAAILAFASCSKDNTNNDKNTPAPGDNEVWIQGMAFHPSTITVSAGTAVKWTNKDNASHTVTSDTGLFDSGSIANSGTYSFTFDSAGTYQYHCTIHPNMTAKVVVQ